MRKLLNTIYVTTSDIYVSKEGETILFQRFGEKIMQLPALNIEGMVFFCHATITPELLNMCSEYKIHVSFISHTGKFLVGIHNPIHGNVRLRRRQYRISDSIDESITYAKSFCMGKIFNSRCLVNRYIRDYDKERKNENLKHVAFMLGQSLRKIERAESKETLLGIEGDAARAYYSVYKKMIRNGNRDGENWIFNGRTKRPPMDEVNAMLSYFYTILAHDVTSALETVGLDPQVGFYHKDRPGRSSLALDVMEELRPYIVDRFVLNIINNRQVSKEEFVRKESGGVIIHDDTRKRLLQEWQKRKQKIITHPFLGEKIEIGLLPYAQALLLARCIRGDLDGYPPYFLR